MANDSDACVPKALTDFVFDLFDSVTLSQIAEEQTKFYSVTFRDLSSKYFSNTPWPSPMSIAAECNGDPLFLALYREITHRHWHAVSRITLRDRIEGWQVYRELFEEILSEQPDFYILPIWAFDILNEFVYQFQGFCQFRTSLYATAVKHGILTEGQIFTTNTPIPSNANQNVVDSLNTLATTDTWEVEIVFQYLHRLVQIGCHTPNAKPAYQYLGIFASIALSRLECLVGDYTASLAALSPLASQTMIIKKDEDGEGGPSEKTAIEVIQSVFSARLSMAYHAGVSFLMLRRYRDASKILGEICAYMQRGFKTGQLRKLPGSDQFSKQYERMIALLAVVTHVCPSQGIVEDSILRVIREKHGSILSKIDAGEEGYEDLFMCPKFVSVVSSSTEGNTAGHGGSESTSSTGGGGGRGNPSNMYKLQVKQFVKEMSCQQSYRKLRSYLKLYTSIATSKLAKFNDMDEREDFLPLLLSYKHKMRQLESNVATTSILINAAAAGGDAVDDEQKDQEQVVGGSADFLNGTYRSALDIHYYLLQDMVHIDEAEKQRRFEKYFVQQIMNNCEIIKDAENINTTV